jgi:hypothetical protein
MRGDAGDFLDRRAPGELPGGTGAFGDFAWHIGVGETY